MNSEKLKTESRKQSVERADQPVSLGRRALLRGGAKAMPAILTLQSGAALAASSNLISAAPVGTRDGLGRALCLDKTSVDPVPGSTTLFDLGNPARGNMTAITARNYKAAKNNGAPDVTEDEICMNAGTYYWKDADQPWQELHLANQGVILSSAAVYSFSENMTGSVM